MKELSDWQLCRVRNALRAYHRYERDHEGRYYTWRDVREAIAFYTDVEIGTSAKNGAERLRQFVEGIEDEFAPGMRNYPSPKPAALEGIVAFLTHEELNLLSEDELEEYMPGFQAPQRLNEFLRDNSDLLIESGLPPLQGQYVADHADKDGWTIRSLVMQRPSAEGICQVVEVHEHYAATTSRKAFSLKEEGKRGNCLSFSRYGGWAILTPEDSLLLFLKHESNGRNHRYECLDDINLWARKGVKVIPRLTENGIMIDAGVNAGMLMLQHDFGYDLKDAKNLRYVMDALKNDLFVFVKTPFIIA
jgi:hypothetical protein